MIVSENKMDHSEMPALADGLTAGCDKQNWGMNLNLHRKVPRLIDIFNFGEKNGWVEHESSSTCCDCHSHARPSGESYCHSEYSGCSQK